MKPLTAFLLFFEIYVRAPEGFAKEQYNAGLADRVVQVGTDLKYANTILLQLLADLLFSVFGGWVGGVDEGMRDVMRVMSDEG